MNILLVDDDSLVLKALTTILEKNNYTVVDAITEPSETLEIYKNNKIDVIILDIRMKDVNGIDIAVEILNYDKNAKILLLTTFNDTNDIKKGLKAGISGILFKDNISTLIPAIESVFLGNKIIDNSFDFDEFESKIKKDFKDLSDREIQIIELVAKGLSNKEIANKMFLSEGTVRNYLSIILEKLDLRDRTQLAIFYLK